MVTIIKNQLLKHLSRYTKNLSPEQISLSALRGSGELQDLTLDEDLLTDLLELPAWVRLSSAKCNRVSFRIQWTKLKTVPIVLNLDEVHIALEVCTEPRVMNPGAAGAMPAPGKYSYIHKVIDGISVAVNQVQVDFNCDAFTSSVQISRVTVESRTPEGRKGDLRLTRIKSPDTGQLLIFKELEWQSARIEAKAYGDAAANLPPLRLLLGNTHCRIVIKKRLSDCAVTGSRLVVRPEPLAWALTDGQLRAALACAAALAGPVQRATRAATRAAAARKIEQPREQLPSRASTGERDLLARMFAKHDVRETSYHLLAPRVDLHLCDDPGLGRSEMPSLAKGGALQVTLVSMQADLFPYHKASDDRRHWRGYREAATPHSQWLSQALSTFCTTLLDTLDPRPLTPSNKQSKEKPEAQSNGVNHKASAASPTANTPSNNVTSQASPTRTRILQQLSKLMTTCLVLRIDDFTVNKVSTGSKSRETPRPLVSAEKATLPGDAGLLHAELTFFYYPGDVCFPVPSPKLYVQLSPVRVSVDVTSVVWLSAFLPHVARALASAADDQASYIDVRTEAIMPKLVLEAGPEHVSQQRDRPKELHICTARATFTNVRESPRSNTAGTRADLASIISSVRGAAPRAGQFPCAPGDLDPIHEQFLLHADNLDDIDRGSATTPELLWRESRAVWCARVEPLWADFCGARATNYKPAPLLDATPLTAWLYFEEGFSRIWVIGRTCGLAGLQLNHYQLLFLLRTLERVAEMMAWLAHDAARQPEGDDGTIVVGIVVPAVELTLVLPSNCPGQESSRDLDSVPLDSSSLQDLKMGSESTMAPSMQDRDSAVLSLPAPIEICSAQPLPAEEVPPSPGISFGGFSSMRRGLTSLVTSLDALGRDDSRSDAASTASSDSERYVLVGLAAESPDDADVAFREFEQGRMSTGVEVAAEVVERSSSPSDHSLASSCRRRDLISTCTWRLSNIHLVQQSASGKSCLRLAADDLSTDECAAIPWDEFQVTQGVSCRTRTCEGVHIVVATPGRLFDHMRTKEFDYSHVQCLVLDEADKIYQYGFEEDLKQIIKRLPKQRQTMLFSATHAETTEELIKSAIRDDLHLINTNEDNDRATVEGLKQGYVICETEYRLCWLYKLLKKTQNLKVMVFFSSCKSVVFHHEFLNKYCNLSVLCIHGKMNQSDRTATMNNFYKAEKVALFCTDLAARGLDIPAVDWIVQFDPPADANEYIHRVGRTARGLGAAGHAVLLLRPEEKEFIEYLKEAKIYLDKYEFWGKLSSLQKNLDIALQNPEFIKMAEEAFEGYIRAFEVKKLKHIFNLLTMDMDVVAKSFGLNEKPDVDIRVGFSKKHRPRKRAAALLATNVSAESKRLKN